MVVTVIMAVVITGLRMNQDRAAATFITSAIPYYIGPFSLLSYYLQHKDFSLIGKEYLWGSGSIGCIYNIVRAILHVVAGVEYNGSDYRLVLVTQYPCEIGSGMRMNAAGTALYTMLRDFGVIAIIIDFIIFGIIFRVFQQNKSKIYSNDRYAIIFVILLYTLFKLSMNYEVVNPSFFFSILYAFLFCKAVKNNEKN